MSDAAAPRTDLYQLDRGIRAEFVMMSACQTGLGRLHPDSVIGLTNAFRALHPDPGPYSYWDYTAGAWQKDFGLLIDHLMLSPQATDRLTEAGIDRKPRGREKPSDHTPVWCELSLAAG